MHEVTVGFVVSDGRLIITTVDNRGDWVQNLLKNPSCQVRISGITKDMIAVVVLSDEREKIKQLYDRKFEKLHQLRPDLIHIPTATSIIFELKPT